MKFFRVLIVLTIALVLNYTSGWTYEKGTVNRTPIQDTVIVPASDKYAKMNALKWMFLGRNYRREWSVPVAMPVFHITSTKGGFTIEKLGGGQQTSSLHLVNTNGSEWILRTVDKNVELAISPKIRHTFIQDVVQDQISASHPYSLLTINTMAAAVGVPSPTAELYYVPDDPALDSFRYRFAHKVCMLLPKAIHSVEGKTEDTDDVLEDYLDSSNHFHVLQEPVLRARLLDMLIADWDRHLKQLEWGMKDSAGAAYFYAVPEDRDQAYFHSQGVLPFVMRIIALPHMVGFTKKSNKLVNLNIKAHDFDRMFMNDLDRLDWIRIIRKFQNDLTDSVIHRAISRMPREAYLIGGEEIEEKLRGRRNGLLEYGLEYYNFLAEDVTIRSSREPERFSIGSSGDSTIVTVYNLADNKMLYHRSFFPKETEKIKFLNVDANDVIERANFRSAIKLEIVPRPATTTVAATE